MNEKRLEVYTKLKPLFTAMVIFSVIVMLLDIAAIITIFVLSMDNASASYQESYNNTYNNTNGYDNSYNYHLAQNVGDAAIGVGLIIWIIAWAFTVLNLVFGIIAAVKASRLDSEARSKVLLIVCGIIAALFGISIIGLIFSSIGLSQTKKGIKITSQFIETNNKPHFNNSAVQPGFIDNNNSNNNSSYNNFTHQQVVNNNINNNYQHTIDSIIVESYPAEVFVVTNQNNYIPRITAVIDSESKGNITFSGTNIISNYPRNIYIKVDPNFRPRVYLLNNNTGTKQELGYLN